MSIGLVVVAGQAFAQTNPGAGNFGGSESAGNKAGEIQTLTVRALLVARHYTTLASQLNAKIKQITVDDGDRFDKGVVLVAFDCDTERAKLTRARAELRGANNRLSAMRKLTRLGSGSVLEEEMARSEVEKAKADVTVMQSILRACAARAPFAGRVVERKVQPFQSVKQGDPLIEIIDDTSFDVHLVVPSQWLRWLKPGVEFLVEVDETGRRYSAKVTKFGANIDPASQTIKIFGVIVGDTTGIIAGMSGNSYFYVQY